MEPLARGLPRSTSYQRVGRSSPPYTGGRELRLPPHALGVEQASSRSSPNPKGEGRRLGAFAASTGGAVSVHLPVCCSKKGRQISPLGTILRAPPGHLEITRIEP